MRIMNLNLQPIDPSTNYENVVIGNSMFVDDVWDLSDFIPTKTLARSAKIINFKYIKSDIMKHTVKQYAYYKLGKVTPQSVKMIVNSRLPSFFEFCSINGIYSFSELTSELFINYNYWLKEEKNVARITGHLMTFVIEEIVKVGQIKGWEVPKTDIFLGTNTKQLWSEKETRRINKTKPIPPEILDKILYHAIHDETDILTKAGIIIQSQTGLRISEVLSIQEGCLKTSSDGYDYMEVKLGKTEKGEPIVHKVFINKLVKDTIKELSKHTAPLRRESGFKELFLHKNNGIRTPNSTRWSSKRLKTFIKRWNICDNNGELYQLKSHQFRATFVRELIKQNVPIEMIMKQFSHVSIEMTAHYLSLKEEEVKEIYADIIFRPDSKIAGIRAKEIKDKLDVLFHGKTTVEIDTLIDGLTKTMNFNPLPTGVCLYDFRRGNCTDGDGCFMYNCPNYLTESQFYPVLKKELETLEKEMSRLKLLGYERQWQVEQVKYVFLKPIVEDLEAQINERE